MKWIEYIRKIEKEDILEILESYEALGPLPGVVIPLLESFLPILPLVVIIIANAAAYGLWKGFLFSWLGVIIGSLIVFLLTRRYGQKFSNYIQRKYPKGKNFFQWIEKKGFTPIFVLSCFPFSPSFVINIVSGLSKVPIRTFLLASTLGKAFMIFLVSLVGYDVFSVLKHPWKLILTISLFFMVWIIGKSLELRFKNKLEKDSFPKK
jgi:uncharacterized membrane protein YdjX (TVP38/TMEM64 family)